MIPSIADACAPINWYRGAVRTTPTLQRHFAHPTHGTMVITTTIWEIALETSSGKLESIIAPGFASIGSRQRAEGFAIIAFDDETAEQAANLPRIHGDPFDRALVAAAQRTGATVLTNDRLIARHGVPVLW